MPSRTYNCGCRINRRDGFLTRQCPAYKQLMVQWWNSWGDGDEAGHKMDEAIQNHFKMRPKSDKIGSAPT